MRFPRSLLTAVAALAFSATTVQAQSATTISERIKAEGLAATQSHLAGLANPTANEQFALGGVSFLRAIETSLQSRYRTGIGAQSAVPLLRLPVPPSRNPEPFAPEQVSDIFRTALDHFAAAEEALEQVNGEVGLPIDLTDLWFDIDGNGIESRGESLFFVTGMALDMRPAEFEPLIVRFDTADVAWLRAYAQLLSGISEVVLAYDPTEPIRAVTEATARLSENKLLGSQAEIDQIAIILLAMRQEPDAARTRKALGHFEAMIAHNRVFWDEVAKETDNEAEWLPNAAQQSAFGIKLSQEVADSWQAILNDGDAVLKGKAVLPFWRDGYDDTPKGINFRKMFTEPAPLDLVLWVQGAGALPYLKEAPLVDDQKWMQFMRLLGGDAPLYALWLN